MNAFIRRWFELLDRKEIFALALDVSLQAVERVSQNQVKKLIESRRDDLRRYTRGVGLAIASLPQRLIINAITTFTRPPFPVRAFPTLPAAEAWCREQTRPDQGTRAL